MQARRLPARRGWDWIVEGHRLFRANPALLTFLVFGYWLSLLVLNLLPLVGMVLASLCVPALSVGVMNGCRALRSETRNGFPLLFSGFSRNRQTLLVLGGIYLAGSLLVFAAGTLFDQGAMLELMTSGQEPLDDPALNERLLFSLQTTLVLMIPLLMAFWFAPLLAAWNDFPAGKALFFSFVACLRNWRAFVVYTLAVMFFGVAVPGLLLGLVRSTMAATTSLASLVISLPLLFVFVPTLFASFYVSYVDVFVAAEDGADG